MSEQRVEIESQGFVQPKPQREKAKPRKTPRYHVVLWNDDDHTFDYVIAMLKELFGHREETGHQLAKRVHRNGKAIVLTTTKEHAELKRDQIHAYGKDAIVSDCLGSMSATIESTPV